MTDFSPAWFLRNPHAQTVWGRLSRPRRLVPMRREVLATPDGDDLVIDHLDTPVTAREPLHYILLHGLEGSSNSVYIQGLLSVIAKLGHRATAMNFRACARDPRNLRRMLPNRRPRFSHSGDTTDFDFLIRMLAQHSPRLVAAGASLGGNVLLKWLGQNPKQTTIRAAATLSVPYDLGAGAKHLEDTAAGRFYVSRFLVTLKRKIADITERFPEVREMVDIERTMRSRTFWEFDDAATAPLHGFRDAVDYYAQSSSIHYVGRITTPTLCISAVDDPFLPHEVLARAAAIKSPHVELRTTPCGGHVGFIGGALPWRCEYWAEELAVRWIAEQAS